MLCCAQAVSLVDSLSLMDSDAVCGWARDHKSLRSRTCVVLMHPTHAPASDMC
jgi:hypothetical protein